MEEEPAGCTAAAVLAELQAVLEQACGALQAQEEGRVHDAVQVGAAHATLGCKQLGAPRAQHVEALTFFLCSTVHACVAPAGLLTLHGGTATAAPQGVSLPVSLRPAYRATPWRGHGCTTCRKP